MPERFVEAFTLAGVHGLKRTARAGEHVPSAETVTTCLDVLGCDRIDHRYHVLHDPDVLWRYRDDGVVFNVAFTTSRHALRPWRRESVQAMWQRGLRLTINSDDPALLPTTFNREFAIATELLGQENTEEFLDNAVSADFTRANRPAIRAITASSCAHHRAGSTLYPAATAGSSMFHTNTA